MMHPTKTMPDISPQTALVLVASAACIHAADAIVETHPSRWVPWACYLLEVLDEKSADGDQFLRDLRAAIDERLEKGSW